MSFHSKVALITGSSRGIGQSIALKLAQQGVKIAVHYYQNETAARDTLATIQQYGADGFVLQADVSQPESIKQMFDWVETEFGKLDIFVHNARPELSTFYQSPLNLTLQQWEMAIDSQAKAFLVASQAAARLMPNGSRIIAITYSPSTRTGSWQPWVAMGSAKAAMESLVRYFAVALAPQGITVNGVSPGCVFGTDDRQATVLNTLPSHVQQSTQSWHEQGWTPMRRLATPADIGNAVKLLCQEDASFITGQILHVDGGASLMDTAFPLAIQQG